MSLGDVDEVSSVRSNIHSVVVSRVGQSAVALAIQTNAVQLQFHRVISVVGQIIKDSHFFVHGGYQPEQPFAGQRWQTWRWRSLREVVPEPHISGKVAVIRYMRS